MSNTIISKEISSNIAMTGEITLKGNVLPIEGLKEKLSAAVRGNQSIVIIPEENKRDLAKIPDEIKNKLTIKTISNAKELLGIVFLQPILRIFFIYERIFKNTLAMRLNN